MRRRGAFISELANEGKRARIPPLFGKISPCAVKTAFCAETEKEATRVCWRHGGAAPAGGSETLYFINLLNALWWFTTWGCGIHPCTHAHTQSHTCVHTISANSECFISWTPEIHSTHYLSSFHFPEAVAVALLPLFSAPPLPPHAADRSLTAVHVERAHGKWIWWCPPSHEGKVFPETLELMK